MTPRPADHRFSFQPSPRPLALAGLAGAMLLLAACASAPTAPPPPPQVSTLARAQVVMTPASASLVSGTLGVTAMEGGVRITGELGGLQRGGTHAIHIHEKGDCSAVDGTSAGPHFNPAAQPHGRVGHGAHHGGDMDNLRADAKGVARVDVQARGVTLGGGGSTDILGRAVIVHAVADDYTSQPAGNAGARVACGIIKAP
jgi:Cu-Zn family superoxide dismutase